MNENILAELRRIIESIDAIEFKSRVDKRAAQKVKAATLIELDKLEEELKKGEQHGKD